MRSAAERLYERYGMQQDFFFPPAKQAFCAATPKADITVPVCGNHADRRGIKKRPQEFCRMFSRHFCGLHHYRPVRRGTRRNLVGRGGECFVSRIIQTVLLHFVTQSISSDAQETRGLGLVSVRSGQGAGYELALMRFETAVIFAGR